MDIHRLGIHCLPKTGCVKTDISPGRLIVLYKNDLTMKFCRDLQIRKLRHDVFLDVASCESCYNTGFGGKCRFRLQDGETQRDRINFSSD
jgi:hypothetical protein